MSGLSSRAPSGKKGLHDLLFGVAVILLSVACAAVLRQLLAPVLGEHDVYPVFIFPTLLVATRFGWRYGATALILGLAAGNFFFAAPYYSLRVDAPGERVGALLYLAIGTGGIYLAESRQRVHIALQMQQARLLDQAHEPIFTWNVDGTITSWNAGAERLYGFTAREALGRVSHELLRTEFPENLSIVKDTLREQRHWRGELRHRTATGTQVIVDSRMSLIGHDPVQILEADRDLTRKKAAEAKALDVLERLRGILNQAVDGIITIDEHGLIQSVNPAAIRLFGYETEEILGKNVSMLMPEPFHSEHDRYLANYLRTGEAKIIGIGREARGLRKDDSEFPLDLSVSEVQLASGRLFTGIVRDITQRKAAEDALRRSETRFRNFVEQAGDGFFLYAADGSILDVNRRACDMLDYPRAQLLGMHIKQIAPGVATEQLEQIGQLLAMGKEITLELQYRKRAGAEFPVEVRLSAFELDGQSLGLALVRDITERRQAEEALRESEERFRQVAENIREVFWLSDPVQLKLLYVSPTFEEIWGRTCASLYADYGTWLAAIHPDDRSRVLESSHAKETSGEYDEVYRVVRPDGSLRWIRDRGFPVKNAAGQVYRIAGVAEDITERRRAEEEATRALTRMQAVFSSAPDGLILSDKEGNLLEWNRAALRLHGYQSQEEVLKPLAESARNFVLSLPGGPPLPLEEWPLSRLLRGEELRNYELHVRRTDISRDWFISYSGTPLRGPDGEVELAVLTLHDVTEHRYLEKQLRQAQKMEAVGQLAGGVAHDFNNLLTIISGYSELMLDTLPKDSRLRRSVQAIDDAGKRAAALTRQLLAFSRQTVLEPKVLDVNQIVAESQKLLGRLIGEDVNLHTVLAQNLSHVKADPGLLGQVVMNLAVNARDAMPTGGKLTIETSETELDEQYARTRAEVRPGRYVLLAVSDTGHGMPPEVLARIWEPFFTTKGIGKGTGLGLAVVHGIVKQSGGHADVYSETGLGTTFKIYLPAADALPAAAGEQRVDTPRRGSETVLLVEDEEMVRELAVAALQAHGYVVVTANDGQDALRVLGEHQGFLDLLVTDVVMPNMGGRALADVLRPRYPHMKILFVSGYTDNTVVRHGILQAEVAFLQKPYTPMSLVRKVRQVLDANS